MRINIQYLTHILSLLHPNGFLTIILATYGIHILWAETKSKIDKFGLDWMFELLSAGGSPTSLLFSGRSSSLGGGGWVSLGLGGGGGVGSSSSSIPARSRPSSTDSVVITLGSCNRLMGGSLSLDYWEWGCV